MTPLGALIAIGFFTALVALWAFGLARIGARSDRRIERMEFPPQAAAGDSHPLGSLVAAPLVPYQRERR